jgi:hypothetical protein
LEKCGDQVAPQVKRKQHSTNRKGPPVHFNKARTFEIVALYEKDDWRTQ